LVLLSGRIFSDPFLDKLAVKFKVISRNILLDDKQKLRDIFLLNVM